MAGRRRTLRIVTGAGAWAVASVLAAAVAGRALGYEGRSTVVMAEAVSSVLLLPAYVLVVFALATRRQLLAVLSAVLVLAHVAIALPDLRPPRAITAAARRAPHFRLFTANVRFDNPDVTSIAAEIRRQHPDVVFIEELTPEHLATLKRLGITDAYPEVALDPRPDAFGTAILSKLPLTDPTPFQVAGLPMTRAELEIAGRRVSLVCVHTRSPVGAGGTKEWRRQLARLRVEARAAGRPLIMAGDFNATSNNPSFRVLLHDGLRDADVERGRGWAPTWKNDIRPLPPLIRLDHVLVSSGLTVLRTRDGTGSGSDHRPVIADIAITAPPLA